MKRERTKTLEESGSRVKYIYQHDITKPLGNMKELYEDEKGLAFVAEVPKTRLGRDVLELMKAGVITENSVGIMPVVKEYENEKDIRYIKEVKLYEISAVTLAANDEAKIQEVKGKNHDADVFKNSISRINTLLKDADISDELGFNIEYVLQCLKRILISQSRQMMSLCRAKNIYKAKMFIIFCLTDSKESIIILKMSEINKETQDHLNNLANVIDDKIEKASKASVDNAKNEVDSVIKGEVNNLVEKFNEGTEALNKRIDAIEVDNKKNPFLMCLEQKEKLLPMLSARVSLLKQ